MKIWQVKASALRIMFSDSGLQFSEDEFKNGVVYQNGNTRDYLVRMEDSIRRGIDKYYSVVGEPTRRKEFAYRTVDGDVLNKLDLSQESEIGFPSRIDVKILDSETGEVRKKETNVPYIYDRVGNTVSFDEFDYRDLDYDVKFVVWYKTIKYNIPLDIDEMEYDLNDIHLNEETQRMLPYYVKGELFEEDEPQLAGQAMDYFYKFLYGLRKEFSTVQTKVKRSKVFTKTN